MKVLREIQGLPDEEIENYCNEKIQSLEDYFKKNCNKMLGYGIGINHNFLYRKETDYCIVSSNCFYGGYIPSGTKLVFGFDWNGSSYASGGNYYYIDDISYIVEFVKFIRNEEIENEYELFDCILEFLNNYFGRNRLLKPNDINRNDMCKMISKNENIYYDLITDHSIKMFKDRGNAVCTENSVLAQNILSFFDIESYIVIGMIDKCSTGGADHAFNLITFVEEKTGERINSLIDFSIQIPRIDIDFNPIFYEPFMIELDELDEKFVDELISGKRKIEKEMYTYIDFDKLSLRLRDKKTIKYYILDNALEKNSPKIFEKKRGEVSGYN